MFNKNSRFVLIHIDLFIEFSIFDLIFTFDVEKDVIIKKSWIRRLDLLVFGTRLS